ncbi:MAG TPA: hypothetical protein VHL09_02165 [Dehalococcoidia bacterium]|nr:hypothetical protein [Dehalococcoidia bacterium]
MAARLPDPSEELPVEDGLEIPPPGVIDILDQLTTLATTAPRVPWSSRAVVDAEDLAGLVQELRERLPGDLAEAQAIVAHREIILSDAEVAARDLIAEAEAEADRLVRNHTVARLADERARRILADAEQRAAEQLASAHEEAETLVADAAADARRQREEADAYSLDVLRRLEAQLTSFVVSVRKGIDSLEQG